MFLKAQILMNILMNLRTARIMSIGTAAVVIVRNRKHIEIARVQNLSLVDQLSRSIKEQIVR